jgi:Fe2+ or Zn2+ uptake regulation protein
MTIKPSLSKAVASTVAAIKKGSKFTGDDILDKLKPDYPKTTKATVLRIMRMYCNESYIVEDYRGGVYKKV